MSPGSAPLTPVECAAALQIGRDIDTLNQLPSNCAGEAPASLAYSVAEILLDMLGADLVGLRLDASRQVFHRSPYDFAAGHDTAILNSSLESWLECETERRAATLTLQDSEFRIAAQPLGALAPLGEIFALSRRRDFPRAEDVTRLRLAANLAALALREADEANGVRPPPDINAEPVGAAAPSGNGRRSDPALDEGHLDIAELKRAQVELRETKAALLASEQNLRRIIDSLPVLAWSARPDGSSDFVNQRWAEYAGVDAETILEWGFLDFYHPDDVEQMVEIWKDSLANKDQMALKGRIRRFDGEYRWFYFAGRKITDAHGVVRWIGANIDIEDLQRAENALKASEAALRESERSLRLVVDTIPVMAWSALADGSVDYFNRRLMDYVGLSYEDLAGYGFYRIYHPDDVEELRAAWEDILRTKQGREIDARILDAEGGHRWFTLRQNPLLDEDGNVVRWYGAILDIEDRKRAEEELRRSQTDLAHVSRMTTLGELAVSIAHEVNQPLMAIVTNAGSCLRWLDEGQLDLAEARQAAESVIRDGHRAGDIIASIRALARKTPAQMAPMDVCDAIREVMLVLNGELCQRGVDPRFDLPDEPVMVFGDRTQLQQVLLNLVMNAAEAMATMPKGKRKLTIRAVPDSDRHARISLLDTGVGIDDAVAERAFEAFFSTKPDGIGMGPSICRSIVEAHGGSIRVSRNDPRGSVFSFTVPLAAATAL